MILNCAICEKNFNALYETSPLKSALWDTDEPVCYACALDSLTRGLAPEEGDFNTAHIVSGEMSEKEWKWLQEDLKAAEEGRSIREYEEPEYLDFCKQCGEEKSSCYCNEEETDE